MAIPRSLRILSIAAIFMMAFAQNALADKITLTGHTDYRDGVGGEFNITAADAAGKAVLDSKLAPNYFIANGTTLGTANGTRMQLGFGGFVGFETFCLEYNETISLGATYNFSIDAGAINGGVAGGVDPDGAGPLPKMDKISAGTSFLYIQFVTGWLGAQGYDYVNGNARAADAEMLQKAFWYLEDERTYAEAGGAGNIYLTFALAQFGNNTALAKADSTDGFVKAINLWTDDGKQKQSQLIMVPDGGTTSLLLGLALTIMARLRRTSN